MNASFCRFVSRHRLLCNLLFDLFLCGICTYMLASIQAAPWVIIAVDLFMILCTYCFCESASNQLLAIAGKALNERCDPLPLLHEAEEGLKGRRESATTHVYLIDYALALSELGDHARAYEVMSEINIDKFAGTLPVTKAIYYNNLAYFCHVLNKYESADLYHKKAMQMLAEVKNQKQRKQLEYSCLSSQAEERLRHDDPDGAMAFAARLSPACAYQDLSTAFLLGQICFLQKDFENAKKHLTRAASYPPSLYVVQQAKNMLEEIA
jgi:tetratricopeptide (TPR) repeat protein